MAKSISAVTPGMQKGSILTVRFSVSGGDKVGGAAVRFSFQGHSGVYSLGPEDSFSVPETAGLAPGRYDARWELVPEGTSAALTRGSLRFEVVPFMAAVRFEGSAVLDETEQTRLSGGLLRGLRENGIRGNVFIDNGGNYRGNVIVIRVDMGPEKTVSGISFNEYSALLVFYPVGSSPVFSQRLPEETGAARQPYRNGSMIVLEKAINAAKNFYSEVSAYVE